MNLKFFILLIFLLTNVVATCSNSQVDINSASLVELDKLTGIGEVKAQAIIDSRPFSSVDDLIDVYGIGEATLDKIKLQSLACVPSEEDSEKTLARIDNEEEESSDIVTFAEEETILESSESIINLNNNQEEEILIYESKNEKINKNLSTGFCVFILGIIFLLIRK